MKSVQVTVIASLGLLALLLLLLQEPTRSQASMDPVTLFCAASNREVIEAIRADYLKEAGREVLVQYGPSQTLLTSLEVSHAGDLFLPADDSYLEIGSAKSLIQEVIPLADMKAVIAVRRGNPKNIRTLQDLRRPDIRFIQANPDAAAIGKVTREALAKTADWEPLQAATAAFRTTVTDIANDLVVQAADAGIVYDAVLHAFPDLEAVVVPELSGAVSRVSIGVTSSSEHPDAALHFARFAAAEDRGLKRYREFGFRAVTGDHWADVPELSLFAGSMLRPAIEDSITQFEKREGVRVNRVYNGCGILVAQMKSGQRPDAYFACDREFMNQVPELFPAPEDVSENELVILVQKGNPHKISGLKDLSAPGLRVGIGHEKQCAMGWLTQNTLREGGVQNQVMQNVTVQTPTGDMLVNQMLTGSLDAAVVYLSNAAGAAEALDAVRIHGIACSVAVQPFAISPETHFPALAGRFYSHLTSAQTREAFEAEGFRWKRP